jgi:hypothetical protein
MPTRQGFCMKRPKVSTIDYLPDKNVGVFEAVLGNKLETDDICIDLFRLRVANISLSRLQAALELFREMNERNSVTSLLT